jgi:hypothetical protein
MDFSLDLSYFKNSHQVEVKKRIFVLHTRIRELIFHYSVATHVHLTSRS